MSCGLARRALLKGMGAIGIMAGGSRAALGQTAAPWSAGTEAPRVKAPTDACDCHMHIYDHRFPVAPNAKLRPPDATVDDYRLLQKRLGTTRNVVVTPSTYGTDNSITLDAIARLGATARGVAVVDTGVTDPELKRLDGLGITGIRFNLVQSGATTVEMLEPLSKRVDALGWHVQIHMLGDQILQTQDLLQRLPSRIVFDHLARIPQPAGVDHPAFAFVRKLIDKGRTWVKLSSAYQDFESRAAHLRRCLEGRAGVREGRAGANGLGQRLAASDRKGRRQAGRRGPVRPVGRLGARGGGPQPHPRRQSGGIVSISARRADR